MPTVVPKETVMVYMGDKDMTIIYMTLIKINKGKFLKLYDMEDFL